VATALRASVAAVKGKLVGTAARGPFDDIMERVAVPAGVTFEADTVGGISGWWRNRRGRGGARRSFTCMAAGSTWERPARTAISSATSLRALELMLSYPIIGSLRASLPRCG